VPEFFIKNKVQPMSTVINLNERKSNAGSVVELPEHIEVLIAERKKAKREPLTPQKIRKTPGLENLTDGQVEEAIDAIKGLTKILFEISCHKETICIDNQQFVYSSEQRKAA